MIIVKIWNDDEGFYGDEGFEHLDVDETQSNYEKELRQEILKEFPIEYPTVVVEFVYEPSNKVVEVIGMEDDEKGYFAADLEESIGEIIARVYDRGNFWVEKK